MKFAVRPTGPGRRPRGGDATTLATIPEDARASAVMAARETRSWGATVRLDIGRSRRFFGKLSSSIRFERLVEEPR